MSTAARTLSESCAAGHDTVSAREVAFHFWSMLGSWPGLQHRRRGSKDLVSGSGERRIDAFPVDGALGGLGFLPAGNDLPIPAFRIDRTRGSEVQNRDVPRNPKRQHRLAE